MNAQTPSGPPSLRELCENELAKQILQSDSSDAAEICTAMEARMQQLLFHRLETEKSRLEAVHRKKLEERCTPGDMAIYLKNLVNNPALMSRVGIITTGPLAAIIQPKF
jgi:hypothetical protein